MSNDEEPHQQRRQKKRRRLAAESHSCGNLYQSFLIICLSGIVLAYNHFLFFAQTSLFDEMGTTATILQGSTTTKRQQQSPQRLLPRVLMGIFTMANDDWNAIYRQRHRTLFSIWNDTRVCSLDHFLLLRQEHCQLIYTFVIGGAADDDAPPELVYESRPILVAAHQTNATGDVDHPDVTWLNIRENMNQGKSQTWLYYASTKIAKPYQLDYIMKCDADALLHLHAYFQFAYTTLSAGAKNAYIGTARDKAHWRHPTNPSQDGFYRGMSAKLKWQYEGPFESNWNGVHVYMAGQLYMLSTDLAFKVADEARKQTQEERKKCRVDDEEERLSAKSAWAAASRLNQQQEAQTIPIKNPEAATTTANQHQDQRRRLSEKKPAEADWLVCCYCHGVEDHDIGAMASVAASSTGRLNLILLGSKPHQRFWEHPVKGTYRWKRLLQREQARMQGIPYKGKVYNRNSSYEAIMMKGGGNKI